MTRTDDDGTEHVAEYTLDTETKEVVQLGGEGVLDVDTQELIRAFHDTPEGMDESWFEGGYDPATDPDLDEATRARYTAIAEKMRQFDVDRQSALLAGRTEAEADLWAAQRAAERAEAEQDREADEQQGGGTP
jgi:hypothetical protein